MQVVEFYPSSHSCIQGCVHCPRAISMPGNHMIHEVSSRQRELTAKVLGTFRQEQTRSALNLSGYIGEYDFELFDDIGGLSLEQVIFNLGTLSRSSLQAIEENLERVNKVLPYNSGNKGVYPLGNIQVFDSSRQALEGDMLPLFAQEYINYMQEKGLRITNLPAFGIDISANNIPERNFHTGTVDTSLKAVSSILHGLEDTEYVNYSADLFQKYGVFTVNGKAMFPDEKNFDISMSGIQAKKSKKQGFIEALEGTQEGDFYVSVFPDSVMVYHSTLNIHLEEFFFSYDEFEDILQECMEKGFFRKSKTLRQLVDIRLQERAQNN